MARTNQLLQNLGLGVRRSYSPSSANIRDNTDFSIANEEEPRGGSFRLGQTNPLITGINKTAGELVTGNPGETLVNNDLFAGGGKTLGAMAKGLGMNELGTSLAENPWLNGNVGQGIQQGLQSLGNLAGSDTMVGSALSSLGEGLGSVGSFLEGGSAAGLLAKLGNAIWALL